jgi:hypothetical protein
MTKTLHHAACGVNDIIAFSLGELGKIKVLQPKKFGNRVLSTELGSLRWELREAGIGKPPYHESVFSETF